MASLLSWGAKKAIQAPPPQEILQTGNFTLRLLKKWKAPDIPWPTEVEKAIQRKAPESAYTGRIDQIWAKVSTGGSPFCGALCYFLTSIPRIQFCNGHWKITTSLKSFDPRKKRKRKFFHQELGEEFSQELHFFTYCAHRTSKLIRMRFGQTGILSDVKMLYFANRKEGKACSYLKLSDKCKWETDKSDIRERSKAELKEGIIAKAEGGYNEQRRLKPGGRAERIPKFRGFFFFFWWFVCCSEVCWGFFCLHADIYTYANWLV